MNEGRVGTLEEVTLLTSTTSATGKSVTTILHNELEGITAKVADLKSENATMQTESKKLSKTHAKTEVGFSKDLEEFL